MNYPKLPEGKERYTGTTLEELKQYIGTETLKGTSLRTLSKEIGLSVGAINHHKSNFLKESQEYYNQHKEEFISSLRLSHEENFKTFLSKMNKAFEEGEDAKGAVYGKLCIEALREYRSFLREYGLTSIDVKVEEEEPIKRVMDEYKLFLEARMKEKKAVPLSLSASVVGEIKPVMNNQAASSNNEIKQDDTTASVVKTD